MCDRTHDLKNFEFTLPLSKNPRLASGSPHPHTRLLDPEGDGEGGEGGEELGREKEMSKGVKATRTVEGGGDERRVSIGEGEKKKSETWVWWCGRQSWNKE
ncbi:hypothetical protein L1987_15597 [Smallanthus sonchifolius]|uniref:Uncharacterized protein n=1 Tax=Smallanthus sonchifolius TaxID=185202 RepID=A0ACB9J6V3_9ASTR|nr:hypothetical protein L1987_15597 [Smallanthus sonchifolius]